MLGVNKKAAHPSPPTPSPTGNLKIPDSGQKVEVKREDGGRLHCVTGGIGGEVSL